MPAVSSTLSATSPAFPSRTRRAYPPGASSSSSPRRRPTTSPNARQPRDAPPAPALRRGRRTLTLSRRRRAGLSPVAYDAALGGEASFVPAQSQFWGTVVGATVDPLPAMRLLPKEMI